LRVGEVFLKLHLSVIEFKVKKLGEGVNLPKEVC